MRRSISMRVLATVVSVSVVVAVALSACDPSRPPAPSAQLDAPAVLDAKDAAPALTADTAAPDASATTTSPSSDAGPGTACNGVELPKSVARLGCAKDAGDLANRPVGFSSDGVFLGACVSACDPCPLSCTFTAKNGAARSFSDFYAPTSQEAHAVETSRLSDEEKEKRIAAIEASVHARFEKGLAILALAKGPPGRPLTGPFPFPDLALVAKGEVSTENGRATLSLGAAVDGEEPVYPIQIVLPPHPMWNGPLALDPKALAKLDAAGKKKLTDETRAEMRKEFALSEPVLAYVDVSKDGSEIGAVAFVTGAMWYESASEKRVPTRTFVAKVYEETAARRTERGDAAGASMLRDKARALAK